MVTAPRSLDRWMEYLGSVNSCIFDVIMHAIMEAAFYSPRDFQSRKHEIAELLFNYNWSSVVSKNLSEQKGGGKGGKDMMKKHHHQVLFRGIITAIGISKHNFLEGIAVFLGSMKGLRVDLNLALTIALYNIPEQMASIQTSYAIGIAEPLVVIIVAYVFPNSLSPEILEALLVKVNDHLSLLNFPA